MAILNNNNRITFGSFLAYFVMSAIISPLGVISAPVAEHFQISLTAANASFTWLTSGVFIGTLIAVFIFDYIRLRQVVIGGVAVICLSLYAIYAVDSFQVFTLCLGLIGVSCGVELSAAAVVIAKIYDEKLRASMLLLTDSFYSMAGVISTTLAGMFLARQFHWSSAYFLAFFVALGIATIALLSRYPETGSAAAKATQDAGKRRWPLSVHFIGLSMLVYLVAFVMIYSWVPNYAQQALGLSVEVSSEIVSRLFLGMFIGQLCMFVLVLKFPVPALVVVCASAATLLTASLWLVQSGAQLQLAMFGLGLATGGLFKTVLSYGTTAVSEPSPKMVSYLIFHAGLGTAIAPFVGSLIVEQFSIVAALQFVTIAYALTLGLILVALWQRRR
jgi:TsgA-like MFS transporter